MFSSAACAVPAPVLAMVDQLLSAMFPGDEEDEQEAYEQRAEGVENAGRQLAALHKKKGGGD